MEQFQIWACQSSKATQTADLFLRAIWQNRTTVTQKIESAFENLMTSNYDLIYLGYTDNFLTISTKNLQTKRTAFVDVYFFDVFTILNQTIHVDIELDILDKFPLVPEESSPQSILIN